MSLAKTFAVTITDPCINPTFTPSSPLSYFYTIGGGTETITFAEILTTNACGAYSVETGVASNAGIFTYPSVVSSSY
jgi:hypothetical protein